MASPIVRRNRNQSNSSQSNKEQGKRKISRFTTRRLAAWAAEVTLVVVSGLVPFSIGAYLNSRTDMNRVPLNPLLVVTEREIARPLALPVSYGTRNVAWPTNFLWTVAILAPLAVSGWQLHLLAKTGSTIPKRNFGIRVIDEKGNPPGIVAVLVREGIGRWGISLSAAYLLWRHSFLFPSVGAFTVLTGLVLLAEATGFLSWRQGGRALHDTIAGTYTIDATKAFTPGQQTNWTQDADEDAAIASVVITPETARPNTANAWLVYW